ncbi:anhydro-N-acetylmuramic acid kinase [Roseospira navarrensis]|uniref:Anhydro-N-acetylmuramic acid kinase n=1 Tax=Roseospira navarrensis TaxID=140058 RepID=A0A7X2D349_9PROT|nr:anhydro-N-acetylmuramic acid kinase [Roseospira navarrensis]MQX36954.1 anhydro-N-acetylmuramic acid kinase [Roseospira navarrensis]
MRDPAATWLVVGLMSGTSMDGIDAALIETDGETVAGFGPHLTVPYDDAFRDRLRANLGRTSLKDEEGQRLHRDIALRHAEVVRALLAGVEVTPDLIGFHGHTLWHDPIARLTVQAGDATLLARETGLPVVADLRQADIAAGGEGAPLTPIYHGALASRLDRPVAVLNVGGVCNATWVGKRGIDDMVAFDIGPGNAPLDDWVFRHTGQSCDTDGRLAAAGALAEDRLLKMMEIPYFARPAPKSLDRREFDHVLDAVEGLSVEDGATTLVALTAAAVVQASALMPMPPRRWLVTGGGRHNPVLMETLAGWLEVPVDPVEAVGWDGDALEAQAFAFLAARHMRQLPVTFPGTTGAPFPMVGGRMYRP